jgi:DNA topoisomerase-1
LVKMLEEIGVGRPSTYATIISTVQARGYVNKEGKSLIPTDIGRVVANFLKNHFGRLVDYEYTAKVEEKLDNIAEAKVKYAPFIDAEFKPLTKEIEEALKSVEKEDVVILGKSDEKCPDCEGEMVIRLGRYGKFYSCAKFPECKGMKDLDGGEENLDFDKYHRPEKCPKCNGPVRLKTGKYGKFWACEDYPDCKGTVPMLLNKDCPDCSEKLVERRSKWGKLFIGCSGYPDCKYIQKEEKKSKK